VDGLVGQLLGALIQFMITAQLCSLKAGLDHETDVLGEATYMLFGVMLMSILMILCCMHSSICLNKVVRSGKCHEVRWRHFW